MKGAAKVKEGEDLNRATLGKKDNGKLIIYYPSIHAFSSAYSIQGRRRVLEPIPAVLGQEAGYTLDRAIIYYYILIISSKGKDLLLWGSL